MATKFDFSALHKSFKPILRDQEVWLIVSIAIGFSADAAAEGNTSLLRVLTILVAFWLLIAHIRRKLELHKEKKVPFLVVVGKSDSTAISASRWRRPWRKTASTCNPSKEPMAWSAMTGFFTRKPPCPGSRKPGGA